MQHTTRKGGKYNYGFVPGTDDHDGFEFIMLSEGFRREFAPESKYSLTRFRTDREGLTDGNVSKIH